MSLKILGGSLKGIDIKSASLKHKNSSQTRPTSVMLRRKFFDANQDLSGWNFIDLCAGTGTMAFEALSRGADSILCNDISKFNFKLLKENTQIIKKVLPKSEITILNLSFEKVLESLRIKKAIIFFDPPYEDVSLYKAFGEWVKGQSLEDCKVVIEFCRQKTMPLESIEKLFGIPDRSYQQGTSFLTVYDL